VPKLMQYLAQLVEADKVVDKVAQCCYSEHQIERHGQTGYTRIGA